MEVKELRGILNHVNPRILAQTRELLDADLATADLQRRRRIWYMWDCGRDQARMRRLSICKFSPHSDDYVWFMAGYYDVIFDGAANSTKHKPIDWGFGDGDE